MKYLKLLAIFAVGFGLGYCINLFIGGKFIDFGIGFLSGLSANIVFLWAREKIRGNRPYANINAVEAGWKIDGLLPYGTTSQQVTSKITKIIGGANLDTSTSGSSNSA